MNITKESIPVIENALDFKLYEGQIEYLINDGTYWFGSRRTGKTCAYCVKLALSDGEPLNMSEPIKYIDTDYGPIGNNLNYSRWFKKCFMDIWHSLNAGGLPVRKVIL